MAAIRLATRRSPLALVQARRVAELISLAQPGASIELIEVESGGDRDLTTPISQLGGVGVFAKEIQSAVLEGRADVAVHSAKDLPTEAIAGLRLAAVRERLDPADLLVGATLDALPLGAKVATGAPRRVALLHAQRPDLECVELRGNMAKRLSQVGRDGVVAVVAAAAALQRLGLEVEAERLDPEQFVPQVGQGALALECRDDDAATLGLLAQIDNDLLHRALRAERAFLAALGSGCSVPAGCHAVARDGSVEAQGFLGALDGSRSVRARADGDVPEDVGRALAESMLADPAAKGLEGVRP